MKKIFYIILITLGLSSCANNSDELPPPPPPPPVIPPIDLKPEDLYGKWEIYYSEKAIIQNPETNPKPAPMYRDIDLDGFTYELGRKDGEYYFTSYNVIDVLLRKGTYETKKDSMIFYWDSIAPDKAVFPKREGRRIKELDNEKGIIKWDRQYRRQSKDEKTKYLVTDLVASRNLEIAPNVSPGVIPAKVKIDFEDLCRGKWVLKAVDVYYDGNRQPGPSKNSYEIMAGTIYEYYVDNDGDRMCKRTTRDRETNKWSTINFPVVIVDDVINYLYWKGDELSSVFTWIEKYNNENSFNDINISRYQEDLKVVVKETWRMDREL